MRTASPPTSTPVPYILRREGTRLHIKPKAEKPRPCNGQRGTRTGSDHSQANRGNPAQHRIKSLTICPSEGGVARHKLNGCHQEIGVKWPCEALIKACMDFWPCRTQKEPDTIAMGGVMSADTCLEPKGRLSQRAANFQGISELI